MKFNILVAALALVSCGSHKQSNSSPFSCAYALTGCGDEVKQPLIKDIGKTTQKELEEIDREHLAQKKMEKARSQSTTEFFEAYFEYLNGLAPDLESFGQIQWQVQRDEGPDGNSVLNGDVNSPDFWNNYMRSLTGFFQDEKQKFGKLGNHTNKIASELSFAILKKAEIQGTEATIESVEVNVDDIGSTSGNTQDTETYTNQLNVSMAPGGVGGSANLSHAKSRSTSETVTRQDDTTRIVIRVTYRDGSGGPPITDVKIFELLGAEYPKDAVERAFMLQSSESRPLFLLEQTSRVDHSSAREERLEREEQERRNAEANARNLRLAEARKRQEDIFNEYYKLPVKELKFMVSEIDGKYHKIDDKTLEAFSFLDKYYLSQRDSLATAIDSTKTELAERIKILKEKIRIASSAIIQVNSNLKADTIKVDDARNLRQILNASFEAACEKPSFLKLPEILLGHVKNMNDLGKTFNESSDEIRALVDTSTMTRHWSPFEKKSVEAGKVADEANLMERAETQCATIEKLYAAVALKLSQQALNESDAQLASLLKDIKTDIETEVAAAKVQAFKNVEMKEAEIQSVLLLDAIDQNSVANGEQSLAWINKRVSVLGQVSAELEPAAKEVKKVYQSAVAQWNAYTSSVSPETMLEMRARSVRTLLKNIRARGLQLSESQREKFHSEWIEAVIAGNLELTHYCYDPAIAFEESCWTLNMPVNTTEERLREFDQKLERFSDVVTLFLKGQS